MNPIKKSKILSISMPLALLLTTTFAGCSGEGEGGDGDGDGDGDAAGGAIVGDGDTGGTSGDGDGDTGGSMGDGDGDTGGTAGDGDGDMGGMSGDGDMTTLGDPPCGNNLAGEEIKKGTACTEADVSVCYRTCGPESTGWKSETCTGGAYVEGECEFPPEDDYSCYAVGETVDESCPEEEPQSGVVCDVAVCTACNYMGNYKDSGGSPKEGYCICKDADAPEDRKWTCASTSAWPCPGSPGCGD